MTAATRRAIPAVLAAYAAFAQSTASRPAFEVASVKPAVDRAQGKNFRIAGGSLRITNQSLGLTIRRAYAAEPYQISGGPGWLDADKFDIDAKAHGDPSAEQMMAMLQALLADRFKLKVHRETREGSVFALTVAKTGASSRNRRTARNLLSVADEPVR